MIKRDYDERHCDEYERDYCLDGDYPEEQEEQDFRYGIFE